MLVDIDGLMGNIEDMKHIRGEDGEDLVQLHLLLYFCLPSILHWSSAIRTNQRLGRDLAPSLPPESHWGSQYQRRNQLPLGMADCAES